MRITALVKSLDHVCCRYRLAAFRPFLERAGHQLQLLPFSRSWLRGFRLPRALSAADIIIVQRRLLSAQQLSQLRSLARWLIYDVDDALFVRDSYALRGHHSDRRMTGFKRMIQAADIVVVGNAFLAEQATLWKLPDDVRLIPTCVDPQRYPVAAHREKNYGIDLSWIGSSATLCGLERMRPLWEEIGRRIPGILLHIICDRTLAFQNITVRFNPWSEADEARALAATDIGISWLPDDVWSQGKCGLKLLQYMAAGLPVVANPVGVQAKLVQDGVNGYLVESADQWVRTIDRLGRNADLRRRMGEAGRRLVESEYNVHAGAAQWLQLLQQLQHGRRTERTVLRVKP